MAPSAAGFRTFPVPKKQLSPNRALLLARAGTSDGGRQPRPAVVMRLVREPTAAEATLMRDVATRRTEALKRVAGEPHPRPGDPHGAVRGGATCARATATSAGRSMVGRAEPASLLDSGLRLHAIYGWPYLPASAIKGVLRAWVEELEGWQNKPAGEDQGADTVSGLTWSEVLGAATVDGEASRPGQATFFDAHPTGDFTLVLDVITPHASDDIGNPVPVPVLAEQGSSFALDVVHPSAPALVGHLRDALDSVGIGARTGSGYGYFDMPAAQEDP